MKKSLLLAITFILTTVIFYFLTLWATPYYVMSRIEGKRKLPHNVTIHGEKVTDKNRAVPLPNPDFLYSRISYKLYDDSVLRISGTVPDSTYWSLGLYQSNSTNYYVVNDRQVHGRFIYYLVKEEIDPDKLKDLPKDKILYSPSDRGLVLYRFLLAAPYTYESLRQIQLEAQSQLLPL